MSNLEQLDLDLSNYELNDILHLFQLESTTISQEDMKRAKRIVLLVHPDKSNLDSKFFLFFQEAYGVLEQIYDFKRHKESSKKYEEIISKKESDADQALISKFTKQNNFNQKFNEIFEKNRIHNSNIDSGYGDWLSSENNEPQKQAKTISEVNNEIMNKKEELRALVVRKDVDDMHYSSNGTDLTTKKPEEYSSDLFSKLPYEDLQKAHTETVVPVSHLDYENKKKFGSMDELNTYRNSQDTQALSLDQSNHYLQKKKQIEDVKDTERAFELAKQYEESEKANKSLWGHLKQIMN